MTETTALDVVAEAPVKKKEVERGNKVLVTPLYGVKGANDARSATRMERLDWNLGERRGEAASTHACGSGFFRLGWF